MSVFLCTETFLSAHSLSPELLFRGSAWPLNLHHLKIPHIPFLRGEGDCRPPSEHWCVALEVAYERRISPFAPSQLERSRGEDKRMRGKERWRLIAWLARLRLLSVFMPHLISDSEWPSCPVMQGLLELNWTLDTAEKST